jgi:Rrf2 family protein
MLLDLAEHRNDGFVSLKDISERQGISKKYLEQIVALLSQPDILRANRGNKGGYMLAKEPDKYTVGEILRITEGGMFLDKSDNCKTLWIWNGLEKIVNKYLDGITLKDILYSGADEYFI